MSKHICFFIYSMAGGGTEKVTLDLIDEFINLNYEVSLICLKKEGVLLKKVRLSSEKIFDLCFNKFSFFSILKSIKAFNKIIDKLNPDGIVSMGEIPNIITPFINKNANYICVEHSINTFFTSPKTYNIPLIIRLFTLIAYKKIRKIVCVSDNVKLALCDKEKKYANKTVVIYNPFNIQNILTLGNDKISYDNTSDKKIFINVGRLESPKNHLLLLDAFADYLKTDDGELWIVGDGSLSTILKTHAKNLGINSKVIFWGYQENPYKFLEKADIFVSSSNYEGFPLVLFEAIICKCRIVTTLSISDYNTLITKDIGSVVPIKNKEALTKVMVEESCKNKITYIPKFLSDLDVSFIAQKYLSIIFPSKQDSQHENHNS